MTRDVAHVSAVELYSAVPDDTVAFFADLMAMEAVDRRGDSVYLHAWDDYER
jgi:catechol 2,3-dioxygenase